MEDTEAYHPWLTTAFGNENVSLVIHDTFFAPSNLFHRVTQVHPQTFILRLAPNGVQGLALPKRFRKEEDGHRERLARY